MKDQLRAGTDLIAAIQEDGFAVVHDVIIPELLETILIEMRGNTGVGFRQTHAFCPKVVDYIDGDLLHELVYPLLGPDSRVVRSVFFDKTVKSNWAVPWHQDLTIAVAERQEVPGFVGWSIKDGLHHVQAPREVLERMLTVRLHLDDCGAENGPLRVLPGTHRAGWLDAETINRLKKAVPERVCCVPPGGALLMRPLLLHASSRATQPSHRRVLHLEFAEGELPGGLRFSAPKSPISTDQTV